jgi:hypothetical protein
VLLDVNDSQLVLVDYQARLMPALADGEGALRNALRLARVARLLQVPVCITEHCVDKLGPTDAELAPLADQILPKQSFSAVPAGLAEALLPRPPGRRAATHAACPNTCASPSPKSPSAAPSSSPAARRTCACCKPRSICWTRSGTSGS